MTTRIALGGTWSRFTVDIAEERFEVVRSRIDDNTDTTESAPRDTAHRPCCMIGY